MPLAKKTIFKGETEQMAKYQAISNGYVVKGTAYNQKKGYWVAFARKDPNKIY